MRIASTACTTACIPDPHTRFAVSPGTSTGSPALSAACRATFMPAPAHTDVADIGWPDAGARDRLANDARPETDRRHIFERAAERADRRAACAEDDRLEVFVHPKSIVLRSQGRRRRTDARATISSR